MASSTRLRVLCLHSFRLSGTNMSTQMSVFSNISSVLADFAELSFCDGGTQLREEENSKMPQKLRDLFPPPYFEWWNAQETGEGVKYAGLDATLAKLEAHIEAHGPFDGYLGFSQGGSVAHLLSLLSLRAAAQHPKLSPPRFGVFISSRMTRHAAHAELIAAAVHEPLPLPSLVIYGGNDHDVPPELTKELMTTLDPQLRTELFLPEGTHRIPKLAEEQAQIVRTFFEAQLTAKQRASVIDL